MRRRRRSGHNRRRIPGALGSILDETPNVTNGSRVIKVSGLEL